MKIQLYQRIMFVCFMLFMFISGYIVFTTNPDEKNIATLIVLYFCIFVSIFSFSSLFLSFFRKKEIKPELLMVKIKSFTRQAVLVAIFIVSLMFLGSLDLLTWWDAVLLAFSMVLFELYFKSNKRRLN
jgi:hypothetical protein